MPAGRTCWSWYENRTRTKTWQDLCSQIAVIIFPVVYIGWTVACFAHILMENRKNLEHIAKHLNNNELFCDIDYLERSGKNELWSCFYSYLLILPLIHWNIGLLLYNTNQVDKYLHSEHSWLYISRLVNSRISFTRKLIIFTIFIYHHYFAQCITSVDIIVWTTFPAIFPWISGHWKIGWSWLLASVGAEPCLWEHSKSFSLFMPRSQVPSPRLSNTFQPHFSAPGCNLYAFSSLCREAAASFCSCS